MKCPGPSSGRHIKCVDAVSFNCCLLQLDVYVPEWFAMCWEYENDAKICTSTHIHTRAEWSTLYGIRNIYQKWYCVRQFKGLK